MSENIVEVMRQRFSSGNDVPVERAVIRRAEWEEIEKLLRPAYNACGGCGADHPSQRCINCHHQF